jgi:hypothetical protein
VDVDADDDAERDLPLAKERDVEQEGHECGRDGPPLSEAEEQHLGLARGRAARQVGDARLDHLELLAVRRQQFERRLPLLHGRLERTGSFRCFGLVRELLQPLGVDERVTARTAEQRRRELGITPRARGHACALTRNGP